MFCEKCGEYLVLPQRCNCKAFNIVDEEGESYEIYEFTNWDAAKKWAQKSNENCDNYLLDSDGVEITVDGVKFFISAEPDIKYFANEIK